jgi:hypothetical protein
MTPRRFLDLPPGLIDNQLNRIISTAALLDDPGLPPPKGRPGVALSWSAG